MAVVVLLTTQPPAVGLLTHCFLKCPVQRQVLQVGVCPHVQAQDKEGLVGGM